LVSLTSFSRVIIFLKFCIGSKFLIFSTAARE
jgi:hypothetical protein